MKKSKLLLPLTGVAMIGTIAPIVTLTSCGCSNKNADKQFLDAINGKLSDLITGTVVAPHKAITKLAAEGFDVVNHQLADKEQEFAFDAEAKKFIVMNGDAVVYAPAGYTLNTNKGFVFKFVSEYDSANPYGQYFLDNFKMDDPSITLQVSSSIDTGNNANIKSISYVSNTNSDKTVLLNTTTEKLTIQSSDTIYHTGTATDVEVSGSVATGKVCTFNIGATVSTLKIGNSKLSALTEGTEQASIAYLEATDDKVTSDAKTGEIVKFYTGEDIGGEFTKKKDEVKEFKEEEMFKGLGAHITTPGLYRLNTDITISRTTQQMDVKGVTVCVDLAGHTITDTSIAEGVDSVFIQAWSGATIVFMDSVGGGQIILKGRYIQALGDGEDNVSTVKLNGGTIKYLAGDATTAPFKLGTKLHPTPQYIDSQLIINGGSIIADESVNTEWNAIVPYRHAYVEVNNGSIRTSGACIAGNGLYDNNNVKINGGTFESTEEECIFHPQEGKLEISGGVFNAVKKACLGLKGGDTTITGGTFTSKGEYIQDLQSRMSGINTDGSVIVMDICDSEYGDKPSLKITAGTFLSEKSYIFRAIGQDNLPETVKVTVAFNDGEYTYNKGDILIASNVQNYITINKTGGTWTQK